MAVTVQGLVQLGFTPEVDFNLRDDSDGNGAYIDGWMSDQPQPSEADITTAHNEWQLAYDNNLFQRQRAQEYPPIVDQLDDIFHNGLDGWKASVQAVKDKYPKP
jgi:hypothetical protein